MFQNEPIRTLVLCLYYRWFLASVCRGCTNIDYTNSASINAVQIPCFTLQVSYIYTLANLHRGEFYSLHYGVDF